MSDWYDILTREIKARNITEVARDLGYARTSVSLVYHKKYPTEPTRFAARVLEVFSREITCPHLKRMIAPAACKDIRTAPMPTNDPASFRHWTACQACPQNPNVKRRKR